MLRERALEFAREEAGPNGEVIDKTRLSGRENPYLN